MNRCRVLSFALLAATLLAARARAAEAPAAFEFIVGPRLGVSYMITTPEEFSDQVSDLYPDGDYFPVYTLFGVTLEQRMLLGQTRSHFAFQELLLVGGLEQSMALPIAALLIGYRDWGGFEVGTGPLLSLSGVGVLVAIGWTLSLSGVYVPIDLSVSLPSHRRPVSIALTTGFNFTVRRKPLRTF